MNHHTAPSDKKNKQLIKTIKEFINSYEIEADNGWPKDSNGELVANKYSVKNKKLQNLWLDLIDQVTEKCGLTSDGDPYTVMQAKGSVFPSLKKGRTILYFYHKDAYKESKPSAKREIYCALILAKNSSQSYKLKLALTQGRRYLEEKTGDIIETRNKLHTKALENANKHQEELIQKGFTTALEAEAQGIEIAAKEYNLVSTTPDIVGDIKNLLNIYAKILIESATKKNNSAPVDINDPCREDVQISRIIRDSKLSPEVKLLNKFECQLCGLALEMTDGEKYAEAHHIQPLGRPHNGPDSIDNMICVCPNHHAQLDYGAIPLDIEKINTKTGHAISAKYVKYHNANVYRS